MAPGCGGQAPQAGTSSPPPVGDAAPKAPPAGGDAPAARAGEESIARKIIYSASVEVIVKDLEALRAEVERIVEERKGYVAKSDVSGESGSRRTATWTLKVPAEKFRDTVAALAALGNTVRNSSDSQDVTEEFIDLQARIKNLKAEEETLNKLLKDQAVRLEDVLKIREQIKTVRGDIERAEGRLKYLATMAAMSTVSLTAREDASYVPPTAPTFGSRVSETFDSSVATLSDFGKSVALIAVALAPWLPLILVAALVLRWLLKMAFASGPEHRRPEQRPRVARPVAAAPADPSGHTEPPADGNRPVE
jgi:hypothetical protein